MRKLNNILVTGGSGFIGSNLIRYLFGLTKIDHREVAPFDGRVINLDVLTYAGNPMNLIEVEKQFGKTSMLEGDERYIFEKADICDRSLIEEIFDKYDIDTVIHLAAESHVDRSILGPEAFIKTNVLGTFTLLDVARGKWVDRDDVVFHHVSTDEVYGSLASEGYFTEDTAYDPRSPYSASKAGSDHIVMAYYHTFGLPITLTNCSNNYGPFQFPEKLIPVMIYNMLDGNKLPIYGDGKNVRDWLYVEDHNSAVWSVLNKGELGRGYNIGGDNEWENLHLVETLCSIVARHTDRSIDSLISKIEFVKDRPGHDRRYAIDCTRLKSEIGWKQSVSFDEGLERTVHWYIENKSWAEQVKSGEYKYWIDRNYKGR
jgi:dTDP-glucose 4,6-dehydratase